MVIVEDQNKEAMVLDLMNQIEASMSLLELQEHLPCGLAIGIKQPYLKVSLAGII